MLKLQSIKPSPLAKKKYRATFNDGTHTDFGATGYEDFTTSKDEDRKERYIKRHSKENWDDPKRAGTLSRYILWNKPTLRQSIQDFKKMFNV